MCPFVVARSVSTPVDKEAQAVVPAPRDAATLMAVSVVPVRRALRWIRMSAADYQIRLKGDWDVEDQGFQGAAPGTSPEWRQPR